jgi:hypothetical protein
MREGAFCYSSGSSCQSAGLVPPVFTFPTRDYGQSVTGGQFFTGDTACAYHGLYIFAEFAKARLLAMREQDGFLIDTAQIASLVNIASIDKDRAGRLFAVSMSTSPTYYPQVLNAGVVYVLESPDMRPAPKPVGIGPNRRVSPKTLTLAALMAHRDHYIVTGLDGREIQGIPWGVFIVRERGAKGALGAPARVVRIR